MDSEQLVWHAWRSLRESDAVFRDLPTLPPLETFLDVTMGVRMAIQIDAMAGEPWQQLPLFGD